VFFLHVTSSLNVEVILYWSLFKDSFEIQKFYMNNI
jgi:hypothetical protein